MNELQQKNSKDLFPTSTTIEEVFTKKNIIQLSKEYSKGEIITAIVLITSKYLSVFNINKPMNADQILLFAEDFFDTYYTDTLDDLKLMFKEVRVGNIGDIYGRIDGQVLFGWYRQYLEKKYEVRERIIKSENPMKHLPEEKLQFLVDRYKAKQKVEVDSPLTFNGWMMGLKHLTDQQLTDQLNEFKDRSALSDAYSEHIQAIEAVILTRQNKSEQK